MLLLAHWTDFARVSVALPPTEDANRWKRCVSDVIGLQAILFALEEVQRLEPGDRAGAIDRAEIGVRTHAERIHQAWLGVPLPSGLSDLIADAGVAVQTAFTLGTEWVVQDERIVVESVNQVVDSLLDRGFAGDLFIAPPGTILFAGSPVAFASGWFGDVGVQDGVVTIACSPQRQVYRQFDSSGRPTADVVRPLIGELPVGQPLLVPVIEQGNVVRRFSAEESGARHEKQTASLDDRVLPVDFAAG